MWSKEMWIESHKCQKVLLVKYKIKISKLRSIYEGSRDSFSQGHMDFFLSKNPEFLSEEVWILEVINTRKYFLLSMKIQLQNWEVLMKEVEIPCHEEVWISLSRKYGILYQWHEFLSEEMWHSLEFLVLRKYTNME